jgi:hypothetical protein
MDLVWLWRRTGLLWGGKLYMAGSEWGASRIVMDGSEFWVFCVKFLV